MSKKEKNFNGNTLNIKLVDRIFQLIYIFSMEKSSQETDSSDYDCNLLNLRGSAIIASNSSNTK